MAEQREAPGYRQRVVLIFIQIVVSIGVSLAIVLLVDFLFDRPDDFGTPAFWRRMGWVAVWVVGGSAVFALLVGLIRPSNPTDASRVSYDVYDGDSDGGD